MSQNYDDINNRNLKKLFEQNEPADDFEKEALEGFATLEDNQHAFELKALVDKRVEQALVKEKKRRGAIIWWAAAGILVTAGLAVLLFRSTIVEDKKNVAITETPKSLEMKEDKLPVVDTQPEQASQREVVLGEKTTYKSKNKVPQGTFTSGDNSHSKTVNEDLRKEPVTEKEKPALDDDRSGFDDNAAPVKFVPAPATAGVANTAVLDESDKKDVQAKNPELAQASEKPVAQSKYEAEDANVQMTERVVLESKAKRLKKTPAKEVENLAKSKKENATRTYKSVSTESKQDNSKEYVAQITYDGGEDALKKDLKKLLDENGISCRFEAMLYFKTVEQIERVEITKAYKLNVEEQKKLTETLLKLNHFGVSQGTMPPNGYSYKIVYKP